MQTQPKKEDKKEIPKEVKPEVKNDQPELQKEEKTQDKKEEVKPEEMKLQLMKKGDYTVHVLIEEVRNLYQKSQDTAVLPVVKVSCFNKISKTVKLKTGAINYIFNEHFYFEKSNLTLEQLDSEKIVIEVYDNSYTDREDYLGIYECDFSYVYNQKNHTIDNNWIALSNPEADDIAKVRGYLKISVSVLHETDQRVELTYKSTNDENSLCIIPPHVKIEFMQLYIYIFRAEQIPDMDYVIKQDKVKRKCNGFITLKYMGMEINTDVRDMEGDCIYWNQVLAIPVSVPLVSNKLVFTMWDKDYMTNEIVGTFEISLFDVLANNYNKYRYIHLYGAPVGKTGTMTNKMNENSEIGSLWKGRVLMKIDYEKTDNPKTKCMNIPKEKDYILKEVGKLTRPYQWIFNINLYDAFVLPKEQGSYSIKIAIQDQEKTLCQPLQANKRNIKFDIKTVMQIQTISDNLKDIGDIFIYLIENNENICFQRISAESFFNNEDILIIKLLPDPSVGIIKESAYSGLVKLKIQMTNKAINVPIGDNKPSANVNLIEQDEDEEDLIAEQKRKKESLIKKKEVVQKTYMIIANIYMTRYLIAGDSDGTSDLYALMKIDGIEAKTSVKYDTLNCIWNESLVFNNVEMDLENKSTWPIIFLQVMDRDNFSCDDFLAYNYIWLSDSYYQINSVETITPKWHQLYLPLSNKPQGQILISFSIIDTKMLELTNLALTKQITPKTKIYSVEVNVLGLRSLKPLSFLPIKKAFIVFDLNSVNISGKDDKTIKSIKTNPKKPGPNPTINTVMKFDIRLPEENIFMPDLQCSVYDYLLAGMVNQMLGIFLIPIKAIIEENKIIIENEMKMTEEKMALIMTDHAKDYQTNISAKSKNQVELESEVPLIGPATIKNNERYVPFIDDKDDAHVVVNRREINKNLGEANQKVISQIPIKISEDVNDPKNFLKLPIYKKYAIPGSKKNKIVSYFDKEDESQIPDPKLYEPIGFNKTPNDGKKHYRRIYQDCLENIDELGMKSPFYNFPLRRGKFHDRNEETGIFEALRNPENKILKRFKLKGGDDITKKQMVDLEEISLVCDDYFEDKEYGYFKGLIRIVEKNKLKEYENMFETIKSKNLLKEFKYLTRFDDLAKKILIEKKVYVRLYILKLGELAKKDILSESDPYLKITLGDQIIDESKNARENCADTDWFKCYDLGAILPGDTTLKIEVWDQDPIFPDELIGYTKIDLEDRFFNDKWLEMKDKPIERRTLKPKGWITMWLEIFESRLNIKKWDISPPPLTELELRMVVWKTENIPRGDVEGVSDEYVTCYIDQNIKQSTDMHFRCQGQGSYNWRIVLPVTAPRENTILNIHAMDNDFFSFNDYLSGNSLQLRTLIRDVYELDVPIKYDRDYYDAFPQASRESGDIEFKDDDKDKFWLKLYKQGANGVENGGRVLLSLEIMPNWKAMVCKVGKGRDAPNVNPYLPPPIGRFEWSLNPFKMINQCVGPEYRRKIYCLCCCSLIILYLIFVVPYILLHLAGEVANPFNYRKK